MGKLLHKLAHGIMPSWLFTGFWPNASSKKPLRFRPRQRISTTSSAPTSPAPLDTDLVYLLTDMDQSTYYYSQSEGEQERPITGNSPSPSIKSKSHSDDDNDDDDDNHHLHVSHNPRMGICAIAATSVIKGRWHDDKHQPPFANKGIKYPTSPASINLQSQHDIDDHQHSHQQEGHQQGHPYPVEDQTRNLTRSSRETEVIKGGCHDNGLCGHGCHHQHQHQPQHDEHHQQHHVADVNRSLQHHGPRTNQHPQHHAGDRSLYKHGDDVYHHAHHNQTYSSTQASMESHHNQTYSSTQPSMKSHPISSLAMGTQHNYDHHHHCHCEHRDQCQSNEQYYQHNASNSNDYHQPYLREFKRKSICLDEDEGKEDGNGENNYHYSMSAWPCVKRQKAQEEVDVAYELPECICEVVGYGSAVMQYSYQNAQFSFWESMVEMIVGNELWGVAELEFLLHCYLALNDPHLHHTICTSFLQVLKDLQQILPLQRCTSMAQENTISVAGDY